MMKMHPIEDAPKDGTEVFVMVEGDTEIYEAFYSARMKGFLHCGCLLKKPTHFAYINDNKERTDANDSND